ncbi:MAG: helix-turn-helix transcriptional regulator [Lachnospiraceae bacterium]|nr:helix-turn-helix transcriptional regulator [Lachnospiraceae bacterium]
MSIKDKILQAENTTWVTDGMSDVEIKTTIELARISAKIESCRLDMGMTQQEFADYMGVSQGMVSKWESRAYNFTIRSLNEIFSKLNLECTITISKAGTPKVSSINSKNVRG